MKKLKYVPIYKGEYGMTPDRYQEIKNATRYHRACKRNKNIMIMTIIDWSIIAVCVGYLMFAVLR